MRSIKKSLALELTPEVAFQKFVLELNNWWPNEYTWSQNKLVNISIDTRENGLCTEIGPFGFRADWGRVVKITPPKKLVFTWQISPERVPEPAPDECSQFEILFIEIPSAKCKLMFEHSAFENHGEGAEEYVEAMNSEMGWDYILSVYEQYSVSP